MREIRIEKITLNIGVGQAGDKLDNAVLLLQNISNSKPIQTKTMKRIPTWGLRPRLPIGTKVTLRGKKALSLLPRLFAAVDNKLKISNFDSYGNISFGIKEYIDIPDVEYNVKIGIIGLQTSITLQRAGFRIKYRKQKNAKIPNRHRITREEAINFAKNKFNVNIIEE